MRMLWGRWWEQQLVAEGGGRSCEGEEETCLGMTEGKRIQEEGA